MVCPSPQPGGEHFSNKPGPLPPPQPLPSCSSLIATPSPLIQQCEHLLCPLLHGCIWKGCEGEDGECWERASMSCQLSWLRQCCLIELFEMVEPLWKIRAVQCEQTLGALDPCFGRCGWDPWATLPYLQSSLAQGSQ